MKISKLSKEDQDRIYATIDVLLQFAKSDELTKNETELTETAEATTPIKEESYLNRPFYYTAFWQSMALLNSSIQFLQITTLWNSHSSFDEPHILQN